MLRVHSKVVHDASEKKPKMHHASWIRRIALSGLLTVNVALGCQQMTFIAFGPKISYQQGHSIVNVTATWEWQLTVVFAISIGGVIAAEWSRRWILFAVANTGLLACGLLYVVAHTHSVMRGVSILGYTRQDIRGLYSFDVEMPAMWWHSSELARQIIMDPSYGGVVVVGMGGAVVAIAGVAECYRSWVRRRRGFCMFCGYNLRMSLSLTCPECGCPKDEGMEKGRPAL